MKYLTLICTLLLIISCKEFTSTSKDDSLPYSWLEGRWERTNEVDGKQTIEEWTRIDKSSLKGYSYTKENDKVIWQEQMIFKNNKGLWSLHIVGDTNDTISFREKESTQFSFTVENPENDFPKEIRYSYFDDVITATISGDELEIPFIFWRVAEN